MIYIKKNEDTIFMYNFVCSWWLVNSKYLKYKPISSYCQQTHKNQFFQQIFY